MAFTTKEQFEAIVKEKYENLTKQEFLHLKDSVKLKIAELLKSGDIRYEKTEDDYEITFVSESFYEIAFNTFKFITITNKLSFKQYKLLSAFINSKVKTSEETEFKQF